MMTFTELAEVASTPPEPFTDRPRLAVAAYLARFKGWFKPSIVSRRLSVVAGFYRTCVIDGLLQHSPARRPAVPAESPTLGFTHLQFEALLIGPAPTWIAIRTPSWLPICPQQPDQSVSPRA